MFPDLRTIYLICGITCLILGLLQFGVFTTRRFGRWPMWWSISNLLTGLGVIAISLRGYMPDIYTVILGNMAQLAGYLLMIVAVKALTSQKIDFKIWSLIILVAVLPVPLFMNGWEATISRIVFGSIVCFCCDVAMAHEARSIARRERLYAAWFLVALYIPTALIFAGRAAAAYMGYLGGNGLFGLGNLYHAWIAMFAVVLVLLRSIAVVLIAAERGQKELAYLAHHDSLTGAFNRAGLTTELGRSLATRRSLMLVDIDHFKRLNDTLGHAAGDEILKTFVNCARSNVGPLDLIGRHGGDEFVIVTFNRNDEEVCALAESIRLSFAQQMVQFNPLVRPTLSIGVASASIEGAEFSRMTHAADEALYSSKAQGRNRSTLITMSGTPLACA